jgi:hypothetical protein
MAIADVTLAPAVVTSWRSPALVPVSTGLEQRFRNGVARQPRSGPEGVAPTAEAAVAPAEKRELAQAGGTLVGSARATAARIGLRPSQVETRSQRPRRLGTPDRQRPSRAVVKVVV